jgi:hypothetical protein
MTAATVVHRSLDGHRYELAGDYDLSNPYTSVIEYAINGALLEFTSGPLEAGRAWAADQGIHSFADEFRVQGGTLLTGTANQRDAQTGAGDVMRAIVWEGTSHSVFTHLYSATAAEAVGVFSLISVTEHSDGIVLASKNVKRAGIAKAADMVKEVPGLGLLEITALDARGAQRLPDFSGTKLKSGELFRDTLDDDSTYFLLATPSALVTVLPFSSDAPAAVANRLNDITVRILN